MTENATFWYSWYKSLRFWNNLLIQTNCVLFLREKIICCKLWLSSLCYLWDLADNLWWEQHRALYVYLGVLFVKFADYVCIVKRNLHTRVPLWLCSCRHQRIVDFAKRFFLILLDKRPNTAFKSQVRFWRKKLNRRLWPNSCLDSDFWSGALRGCFQWSGWNPSQFKNTED